MKIIVPGGGLVGGPMARTTGYTATMALRLVAEGLYTHQGISPPVFQGRQSGCVDYLLGVLPPGALNTGQAWKCFPDLDLVCPTCAPPVPFWERLISIQLNLWGPAGNIFPFNMAFSR